MTHTNDGRNTSWHRIGSAREPNETDEAYVRRTQPRRRIPPLRCRLRLHKRATVLIRCFLTPEVPGHDRGRMQKTIRQCVDCGLTTVRVRRLRDGEPARHYDPAGYQP